MTFGNWPENVHNLEQQKSRMASAASAALTPINIDYEIGVGVFSGRHGTYQTTLDSCNCGDFHARHLPCKHIYRLAYEIHHIDLGKTVMYNVDKVVNPDVEDRKDNAIRIALVIDEQPQSSYAPMLTVLRAIKDLGRHKSSIESAIECLESKISTIEPVNNSKDGVLCAGKVFVLTGDFSLFTRTDAVGWLESKGAKILNSLSSKTNYLIVGQNPNEGKLRRAEAMGIPVISEQDFLKIIQP